MDKNGSRVCAGSLQSLYEEELRSIEEEKLLSRLWAQDETLWPRGETGPYHLKGNLEFLKIPEMLPQMMGGALRADLESKSQGLTDRILIAFGTVHHFCDALLNIHPTTEKLKSIVLDSCHPDAVRATEARAERAKTLVVVVNKSAYRLEDHSLFLYFHKKLNDEFPGHAGEHFVASSERNSFLATIASEYNFRFLQELPAGILAPYCSALFLAILLAGAADVDPEVLRVACRDMKKLYAEGPSIAENPACSLAAILAVAAGERAEIHSLSGGSCVGAVGDGVVSADWREPGKRRRRIVSDGAYRSLRNRSDGSGLAVGDSEEWHGGGVSNWNRARRVAQPRDAICGNDDRGVRWICCGTRLDGKSRRCWPLPEWGLIPLKDANFGGRARGRRRW